ncbi:histidine phosphatase family protein [Brachybacterium hainanense]|uniref:Histidine phosphatase family protein n=1 Tax=Brachybacterium hainanense TaxID=1541174 RepID=A0ABV6R8U5_9MICO
MDRLLLIRHGRAGASDDADPPLSETGTAQVRALAARLAGISADGILHGPRRRARQSAQILADRLGLPLQESVLLEDRTPYPSRERRSDYPAHRWEWHRETPEEERDIDGRGIAETWARLSAPGAPGTLLAVSHAFVIAGLVGHALGAPPDAWMKLPIDNASITELIARGDGEWAVARVGDSGHLTEPG